jgi:predicted acetyltransferase
MTIETRTIREEELAPFIDAMSAAFLERPEAERIAVEVQGFWDLSRSRAAFDGGRIVGTFRSFASELTVPGGARLPAGAVAAVSVLPTHRRRGILRAMVAAEHAAMRERGETVGLLYAAEYPIYGRFGYGPGVAAATWTLDAAGSAFHREASGSIEIATPNDASRDVLVSVFEAWRMRQPGEIRRRDYRWDFDLGLRESAWGPRWKGLLALHRDAEGAVDGYVRYRPEAKWEQRQPRGVLTVNELHALTDEAYAALWQFLAASDLVTVVKAEGRSPAERLPWLLRNARAAVMTDSGDGMWVRLFDISLALEARTYERTASLVLEVVDPEADGGRVRVRLEAGPDGATCAATKVSPDVTVDVAALSAAYLGGTRLRDAALATGWDEHRAGAFDEADALLATRDEPWCSTFF